MANARTPIHMQVETKTDKSIVKRPILSSRTCPYGFPTCDGLCTEAGKHQRHAAKTDRRRFFSALLTPQIRLLRSSGASREILFGQLFDNVPWANDVVGDRSMHARLHEWFTVDGRVMRAAADTLLLAQLATVMQLEDLHFEAQKRHAQAIHLLGIGLAAKGAEKDSRMLTAVDALGVCEHYPSINSGGDAWRQHARGLCSLVAARGPSFLHPYLVGLPRDLIFNAMTAGVMDAILSRKAFVFSRQPWLESLEAMCNGKMWCFFHIACRTPELFEQADVLRKRLKPASLEVSRVLAGLVDVERRFQDWLCRWYEEDGNVIPKAVRQWYAPRVVRLLGVRTDVFPTLLEISTLAAAVGHSAFWTGLMVVQTSIYNMACCPAARDLVGTEQRQKFERAAYETADTICQAAPLISDLQCRNEKEDVDLRSDIGENGGVHWAADWYERRGDWKKLEFCQLLKTLDVSRNAQGSGRRFISDSLKGNGLLLRRKLWQECIGPSSCSCRDPEPYWLHGDTGVLPTPLTTDEPPASSIAYVR